jgi:hypothetical protein
MEERIYNCEKLIQEIQNQAAENTSSITSTILTSVHEISQTLNDIKIESAVDEDFEPAAQLKTRDDIILYNDKLATDKNFRKNMV